MASIGLRNAISAGDVRVMHLLLWAGLEEHIDEHTIIYALRHAGGNKVQVVNLILMQASRRPTKQIIYAIPQEIEEIKDEGRRENDQEKLDFIDVVTKSIWYEIVKSRMEGFARRRGHLNK